MSKHEYEAQQAGEAALLAVYEDGDAGGCSCETCVVREVLEAAWPHLRNLALEEAATELTECVHEYASHAQMGRFARELGLMARRWLGRE